MNGGPSGFYNAPITRTFVVACCLFTILFGIQGRSSKLGFSYQLKLRLLSRCLRSYTIYNRSAEHKEQVILIVLCALYYLSVFLVFRQDSDIIANVSANDWPSTKGCWVDIWKKLQLWKLIVSVFSFSSTPELLFGAYLLYYFRVFERQIGSNKYSVFISFSIIVSSLLQLFAQAFLNDPSLSVITSGPYGLIFSSFVPFFFDIPVSTRFRVASLSFSDKSFTYLAGLQLLFSSWKRSLIPGLCGILAGSLYRSNVLRIRRLKFPDFIASFFSRLSLPSVSGTSPALPARNAPSFAARQVEGNYSAPPVSFTPEPPEESIATLVSMGFDRNSARQALVHARNDVNAATNILLESQSH